MKISVYKVAQVFLGFSFILGACADYLDVVPDNVATIDNAFANRNEAEKYLFTCYSYLPQESFIYENPAMLGGDELWTYWPIASNSALPEAPQFIARGNQGIVEPYMNYWNGTYGGKPLFMAIRDCNIFLENVDKVVDLDPYMKTRWIGEVEFLKAYYHYYLLRMYGPIPIIDENLPITATKEEVRVARKHVDEVFDYIVNLIDAASTKLPITIQNRSSELGHITKPIALSMKAKIMVTAASPLFNGNSDFAVLKDRQGTALFSATADQGKWLKAAEACKDAIEVCNEAGIKLFEFSSALVNISDRLKQEMSIRNSICEPWNEELIWGFTNGTGSGIQNQSMPRLDPSRTSNQTTLGQISPTLKMAELFYTENGVPIDEDRTWDYATRYNLRTADNSSSDYLQQGYTTASLHFNREPRFYADLAFDGSIWYMANKTWTVQNKSGQMQSRKSAVGYSITGYYPKKLVNWKYVIQDGQNVTIEQYPWPVIRLADLYLLYAEALNEYHGPTEDAIEYLDKVRKRAGLSGVKQSWDNFSTRPNKYGNKDGLREIIHQERLIELAFEGNRFWDLRRWKEARSVLSQPIYGWDIEQKEETLYYRRKVLYAQRFSAPRDYFWPIREIDLIVNPNLVQNLGW